MTLSPTRIAIPNKGRLADPAIDLLNKAGFRFETSSRALSVPVRNMPVEVLFIRADDIPELVFDGAAQFGITGLDLVAEASLDTTIVSEFGFGNRDHHSSGERICRSCTQAQYRRRCGRPRFERKYDDGQWPATSRDGARIPSRADR